MTKDELKNIPYLDGLINSKIRQLDQLKQCRGRLPTYKGQESVQSGIGDPTAGIALKIVQLSEEISRDIERLIDLKAEARVLFKQLDDDLKYKSVMELRYLECMTWREVAQSLHFSYKHVFKLHGEALRRLYDVDTK